MAAVSADIWHFTGCFVPGPSLATAWQTFFLPDFLLVKTCYDF